MRVPSSFCHRSLPSVSRVDNRGFTLMELLVTLTVLGIVMTLAAPSFASFVLSNRLKTTAFELVVSLNYARSEAIKRNVDATVTPSISGWSGGWSVQSAGQTFKTFDAPGGIQINPVADGVASTAALTFKRNGRPTGFNSMMFTVRSSTLTDNRFVRCVLIDFGGAVTIRDDTNQDGNCANG
jgi:type IV fimbrial biogenesis protein FimT